MEAEAFLLGIWKDFEEMEMTLTMEELGHILNAKSRQDMRHWKFQASLKGINLDDKEDGEETQQTVETKMREMQARAAGVDKDTFDLNEIGIAVETE